MADVCVNARVTQTYVSSGSHAQDVVYVFPLPSDAAVCAFTAVIDDERTITGVVKQKDEAKRDYDKAVSEGRTAGLLDQHTASVFQVSPQSRDTWIAPPALRTTPRATRPGRSR